MMAVAVQATQAPIQPNFRPAVSATAPTGPLRVPFPSPNSRMRSGTDQRSRKTTHATRKEPPPLLAATRGKRQMFPVPTAIPSMARSIPQRELKTSDRVSFTGSLLQWVVRTGVARGSYGNQVAGKIGRSHAPGNEAGPPTRRELHRPGSLRPTAPLTSNHPSYVTKPCGPHRDAAPPSRGVCPESRDHPSVTGISDRPNAGIGLAFSRGRTAGRESRAQRQEKAP